MTTRLMVSMTRSDGSSDGNNTSATCQMEVEIDEGLDADGQVLLSRVHQAFTVCRRGVERELGLDSHSTHPKQQGNGHVPSGSGPRPATEAQVRAIHAIASKTNTRLASHLDEVYGVSTPQSLSLKQASELIGKLKQQLET